MALRCDRQFGAMGGQFPLPFVAVDTYARRYGIAGDDFDLLLRLLTAMDAEYLGIANKKEGDA